MTKLNKETKLQIYYERKQGASMSLLVHKYGMSKGNLRYMIQFIDMHGEDAFRKGTYRKWPNHLKEQIILEALEDNDSLESIGLKYGLPNQGTLPNWIRKYKEDGCVILEKKKGRSSMKKPQGAMTEKSEEMTNEQLIQRQKERILYLEAEVAYLKKKRQLMEENGLISPTPKKQKS